MSKVFSPFIPCGVSTGSILGSILFSLYLLPLGHIIPHFNTVPFYCYGNDTQSYVSYTPENCNSLDSLRCCFAAIKD